LLLDWRSGIVKIIAIKRGIARAAAGATLAAVLATSANAGTLTPLFVAGGTSASYTLYDLANAQLYPNSADTGATCGATSDCAVEQLFAAVGTGSAQTSFLNHAVSGSEGSSQPPYNDPINLPGVWTSGLSGDIDYAQGDAPLSVAQLNTYDTVPLSSGATALQTYGAADIVPVFGNPIAIAFNGTNTGLASGATLQLSQPTLCGIFTGTITNWDASQIAADNPGVTFNNLPITVVVRSDTAGSTFILAEALNADCSNFASVTGGVGLGSGTNAAGTLAPIWGTNGGTFVQEKGSGGIVTEVNATAGSIGYDSVSYVQPFSSTGPLAAAIKNAKGKFETPTVSASALALKGPFGTTGPSGTANGVTTIYPNPVTNQILYLAQPSQAGAYPIVGFAYDYFYQCSDATTTTTALTGTNSLYKSFILKTEVGTTLTPADTIVESTGLVPLSNAVKTKSESVIGAGSTKIVNGPKSYCTITS
jgi:phosphate transport system substrate-binding protein